LLADPVAYRDDRTAGVIDQVHARVTPEELYAITGTQFLPFNTIYQLVAEQQGPLWPRVARAVLLPDLFAYCLTGELGSELTNASTTGLLDVRTQRWSSAVLERIGLAEDLFPPIGPPGEFRGRLSSGAVVTTVGSHDTASAVVGVPATTDRFAYVCCGTWALVGLEIDHAVVSEAAARANFTNEVGLDGRIRFLRNVGGLWLLQECLREWGGFELHRLLARAAELASGGPIIEVDDPRFIAPGGMPRRIAEAVGVPMSPPETVRCVMDSLASAFGRSVRDALELADVSAELIHLVGGGSEIGLLCQLTADAAQLPVLAGPVEATAFGNIVIQARAHGALPASLEDLRRRVAASVELRRYEPA
jgi:rhamnulokinase